MYSHPSWIALVVRETQRLVLVAEFFDALLARVDWRRLSAVGLAQRFAVAAPLDALDLDAPYAVLDLLGRAHVLNDEMRDADLVQLRVIDIERGRALADRRTQQNRPYLRPLLPMLDREQLETQREM